MIYRVWVKYPFVERVLEGTFRELSEASHFLSKLEKEMQKSEYGWIEEVNERSK